MNQLGLFGAAVTLAVTAVPGLAQLPVGFRTPDGSMVVLLPAGGPPLVHWAVATPCGPQVDPPTAPGTAAAAMLASMRGTWATGSLDAEKEKQTLAALDAAETDLVLAPRADGQPPAELVQKVEALRAAAAALCDPQAFRRVLAATPTQDVTVRFDGDVALLEFTTVPFAVPALARLLVQRREAQALRQVREDLQQLQDSAVAAWDREPLSPLYAEVLALSFPGHPLARSGDRPVVAGFRREFATATWARAQHPVRTVHVLTGSFDVAAVRTALEQAFAATALPAQEPLVRATPRAQTALRRALVPGAHHPAAVLAFPIPAMADPVAVATAADWFAGGRGSWLQGELVRQGRKRVEVAVRAPWPPASSPGLVVIEVQDPEGGAVTIADEVLKLCAAAVKKEPRPGDLPGAFGTVLHDFELRTHRPLDEAGQFASWLLQTNESTLPWLLPHNVGYPDLPALLQRILDGNPVVIEWRDA
jgi:hypothetical protein